jgi:opacity protein-like surface antigen
MTRQRACPLVCLAVAAMLAAPAAASAQAVGFGPKITQVRGDVPGSTDPTRLFGGTLRIMSSTHIALEGTLDYRAEYNDDRTVRMRETPIQGSLLIFPVRKAVSPYLLAGIGLYTRSTDTLGPAGTVLDTVKERKTGWHLGAGAEVFVVRQAAIFVDYRWRFVRFGEPEDDEEPIDIPGLDDVKLSHRGSMWSGGLAFYF